MKDKTSKCFKCGSTRELQWNSVNGEEMVCEGCLDAERWEDARLDAKFERWGKDQPEDL